MKDQTLLPSRKNPRLRGYDYATPNYYFITICCHRMEHIFGPAGKRNPLGDIAHAALQNIPHHFPNAVVDKFVVMPNHVHAILVLNGQGASVPVIIGQYKSFVTRSIREIIPGCEVWQNSFHDHIIRNQKEYEKIWLYIDANPQNWEKDCHFTEFCRAES